MCFIVEKGYRKGAFITTSPIQEIVVKTKNTTYTMEVYDEKPKRSDNGNKKTN